jgi:sucrose-6-phosphate hydrolase SacC (GH32 family)
VIAATIGFALLCGALWGQARPNIFVMDFEGETYGDWVTTGEAFGASPARGALPNQMPVSGFVGRGLVNSFVRGDGTTGTLTSPEFTLARRFLNFLIGGGRHPGQTGMNLLIDNQVVRSATGTDSEHLTWQTWDLRGLEGKKARLQIIDQHTGGWGHINVDEITMSDERQAEEIKTDELYNETYRPQFHFTAKKNWLNDPNGLVFYNNTYHLFFQHNPTGIDWGNMHWGHATSPDLVHWTEHEIAIFPDKHGPVFSGSAIVDWNNDAGLQEGTEKTLLAFYTGAAEPAVQCLAYSNDGGKSWKKYEHNPILKNITPGNRDPKVIWHAPSKQWIMALYVREKEVDGIQFFGSRNLKEWVFLSKIEGFYECPDLFELPVEGDAKNRRFVLFGADGGYRVGQFDGKTFLPETEKQKGDYGANFYAAQTYSDIPAKDGRRILIGWMNGGSYPQMPFNQQMTFPTELTLRTTPEGIRLFKTPVREIERLYAKGQSWRNITLKPDENPLANLKGDTFDIQVEFEMGSATEFGIRTHGATVGYHVGKKEMTLLSKSAPLVAKDKRIQWRVLIDRTSLETRAGGAKSARLGRSLKHLRHRPFLKLQAFVDLAHAWRARCLADPIVSHAFSHGFHPQHSERLRRGFTGLGRSVRSLSPTGRPATTKGCCSLAAECCPVNSESPHHDFPTPWTLSYSHPLDDAKRSANSVWGRCCVPVRTPRCPSTIISLAGE